MGLLMSNRFNVAHVRCCFHCGKSLNDTLFADDEPRKVWSKNSLFLAGRTGPMTATGTWQPSNAHDVPACPQTDDASRIALRSDAGGKTFLARWEPNVLVALLDAFPGGLAGYAAVHRLARCHDPECIFLSHLFPLPDSRTMDLFSWSVKWNQRRETRALMP